ncbi:PadR family transcriptional regulator [Dyadobacter sandarakinus]|uniref:PadR family transcriptional regulator n=1 Tax=Dyadobacter sandarakinus TaxID=2747268 RepID=A0ABX7I8H8_9BACT|nr:PadR family transcriptional regulator [Dyadobacter sandarakinus]QRR02416.1 PadR family transcriptional regulator [Dyadobacter sandarakinus]
MRRTYLGEFEELVLLMIAILEGDAYGVTVCQEIEQQTGRIVTFGAVHNTLIRLEEKGFVTSGLGGATNERGGRRKRLFQLTTLGKTALTDIQELRNKLWKLIPDASLKLSGI